MKKIDKKSRIPLYCQLIDIILEQIDSGILKEDDKLPSEREICEIYDISRSTVRQAMLELENDGYIYKQHGKGAFISPKMFKQDLLKFYSFTEEMKKLGKTPSSKVLDFEIIECNKKVATKMGINIGDRIYKFTRLRFADDEPIMLEVSYLPCDRFSGLEKEHLEREAMYDIFTKKYNAVFTKAEETFSPVNTRESEAFLLKVDEDVPSMMTERITYERERIIEYTTGIARGDKFKYRVVLEK